MNANSGKNIQVLHDENREFKSFTYFSCHDCFFFPGGRVGRLKVGREKEDFSVSLVAQKYAVDVAHLEFIPDFRLFRVFFTVKKKKKYSEQ